MPLSYSQIQLYQRCPRQYEFACVKKIPRSISAGESFGSSIHNTLKKWGELELQNYKSDDHQITMFAEPKVQTDLTASVLQDLWHQSFIVEGYDSRTDADAARIRGETIMQHFYEWWSQAERDVAAVEKSFRIRLGSQDISGRFDRIERTGSGLQVIDFKSSAVREQTDVDNDLQLSLYALACEEVFGEPCSELVLLFLREDGIHTVTTTRTPQKLTEAKKQIEEAEEGIAQKAFEPDPSEQKCGRCPYRRICSAAV